MKLKDLDNDFNETINEDLDSTAQKVGREGKVKAKTIAGKASKPFKGKLKKSRQEAHEAGMKARKEYWKDFLQKLGNKPVTFDLVRNYIHKQRIANEKKTNDIIDLAKNKALEELSNNEKEKVEDYNEFFPIAHPLKKEKSDIKTDKIKHSESQTDEEIIKTRNIDEITDEYEKFLKAFFYYIGVEQANAIEDEKDDVSGKSKKSSGNKQDQDRGKDNRKGEEGKRGERGERSEKGGRDSKKGGPDFGTQSRDQIEDSIERMLKRAIKNSDIDENSLREIQSKLKKGNRIKDLDSDERDILAKLSSSFFF